MAKRKFAYDKVTKTFIDITPEHERKLCDELEAATEPFKEHWLSTGKRYCTAGNYPRTSDAMGVNPARIKDAQKLLAEHGVHTEYTSTGEPILRDKKHEREHMKALGYYHRNAGYSDVAPEHFTMDHHPDRQRRELEKWVRRFAG